MKLLCTLFCFFSTLAAASQQRFLGFDRNDYPGDARLAALHQRFAFTGYWLNNPPGAAVNSWQSKRPQLHAAGFGFLVLWNGRLDAEIKASQLTPKALGQQDAAAAIAAARREGFPPGTILFLDQEEGGRLLPEQAGYFFSWTETIAASSFKPGAYVSGQPAPDGTDLHGKPLFITTAQLVKGYVSLANLHPVTLWVAQDTCPPSPGCAVAPPALKSSGIPGAEVWQFAQSPRRPELTRSCAATYAADGNCYAAGPDHLPVGDLAVDLNVALSADPSHGR